MQQTTCTGLAPLHRHAPAASFVQWQRASTCIKHSDLGEADWFVGLSAPLCVTGPHHRTDGGWGTAAAAGAQAPPAHSHSESLMGMLHTELRVTHTVCPVSSMQMVRLPELGLT